jgi:hypothetical protein
MTREVERFLDEIRTSNPKPTGDVLRLESGLEAICRASAADMRMLASSMMIQAVASLSDQSTGDRVARISEITLRPCWGAADDT